MNSKKLKGSKRKTRKENRKRVKPPLVKERYKVKDEAEVEEEVNRSLITRITNRNQALQVFMTDSFENI
jgi:hypothetical protein